MKEKQLEVILSGFIAVQDHKKSMGKKENVRYRKLWRRNKNNKNR
jgi:hypothetical protein